MIQHDTTNTLFQLAADLVNHTSRHIFLTGKAGTGKTTFLRYIKETTSKNTVIVAPTGVAAINAGGVTMHSFFQLPFGPFISSGYSGFNSGGEVNDRHSLFRTIRFAAAKRELLQELELLIIDEVSMVRCDMLDAMDAILRYFRKRPDLPFGGVQVVYIGDMFQLPPVISQGEWSILQSYYESPFFFHAKALAEAPPLYIELKKIYRQNEQHFIDILNRIRNNISSPSDLQELNKRYDPSYNPSSGNKFITLSTHNRKADVINEDELKKLSGRLHTFKADLTGDFSDKALPTEMNLQLKEGAQVMFVKNDSGTERRYYNGKLAIIKKIVNDEITVSFTTGEEDLKLEKETWKNVRYNYNKEKDNIEEEEMGSFKQYPIRLAWAITIHKSQGLTFEKAIIDAGESFAAGQVYVALSRCTSLDGLVLHSKIYPSAIATDKRVLEFAQREVNDEHLEKLVKEEKEKYQADILVKTFNWSKIVKSLNEWKEIIEGKKLPDMNQAISLNAELIEKAANQKTVADKFQQQLQQLLQTGDKDLVHQRVNKAILYFARTLTEEILQPLQQHLSSLKYASKVKRYCMEVQAIQAMMENYLRKLNTVRYSDLLFVQYAYEPITSKQLPSNNAKKVKQEKGASQKDTLTLFRNGKTLDEIAVLRNLAPTTIEGHLAMFVYTGEVNINELVDKEKQDAIIKLIEKNGLSSATTIKQQLSDDFTYGEIRAVMNYYRLKEEKQEAV